MFKSALFAVLVCLSSFVGAAPYEFESAHALVIDEDTGEVLFEKDAGTAAPIASMTKLMTAMVVLDARLPADETIRIDLADLDYLKGTKSGVPVGAEFSRRTLLELALMSSDNHAAHALARTFPGGMAGFLAATHAKIAQLGLRDTGLVEPTGLSPNNHASARDMAKIVQASAGYPEIVRATSQASNRIEVNGERTLFRNTNRFVGQPGWEISVSKTGFTREAGRCLGMRLEAAGRRLLVVLMGAMAGSERAVDVMNVQRWVGGTVPDAPAMSAVKTVAVKSKSTSRRSSRTRR